MSPRVLRSRRCPHCAAELPVPAPRVCPECAGSLQKRYLASGCLSSKPTLVLLAAAAAFFAAQLSRGQEGGGPDAGELGRASAARIAPGSHDR